MMPPWDDKEIELTALRMRAVAQPTRLAIVCLLAEGERCVGDIRTLVGTSQPNVTQHLTILHNLRLLKSRKEANRVLYAIGDARLASFIRLLQQSYCPADQG